MTWRPAVLLCCLTFDACLRAGDTVGDEMDEHGIMDSFGGDGGAPFGGMPGLGEITAVAEEADHAVTVAVASLWEDMLNDARMKEAECISLRQVGA